MRLGGRLQAAIEVLSEIDTRHRPVPDALKDWGLSHRFAGSGDRAAISNLVHDALRMKLSHGFIMGGDTPADLAIATEYKTHTRLGSRLNYEKTGLSSLFRKTGRAVGKFDTDTYTKQFEALDPAWEDGATWVELFKDKKTRAALPFTARTWNHWATYLIKEEGDDPAEEDVEDFLFTALYSELAQGATVSGLDPRLVAASAAVASSGGANQNALFIEQTHRNAVELGLTGVFYLLAAG